MNTQLFKDALSSIIVTSDFVEFLESGQSFIFDALMDHGYSPEQAAAFLIEIGETNSKLASDLFDAIKDSDLEDEFDLYTRQDENVAAGKEGLIRAVEFGCQMIESPKH